MVSIAGRHVPYFVGSGVSGLGNVRREVLGIGLRIGIALSFLNQGIQHLAAFDASGSDQLLLLSIIYQAFICCGRSNGRVCLCYGQNRRREAYLIIWPGRQASLADVIAADVLTGRTGQHSGEAVSSDKLIGRISQFGIRITEGLALLIGSDAYYFLTNSKVGFIVDDAVIIACSQASLFDLVGLHVLAGFALKDSGNLVSVQKAFVGVSELGIGISISLVLRVCRYREFLGKDRHNNLPFSGIFMVVVSVDAVIYNVLAGIGSFRDILRERTPVQAVDELAAFRRTLSHKLLSGSVISQFVRRRLCGVRFRLIDGKDRRCIGRVIVSASSKCPLAYGIGTSVLAVLTDKLSGKLIIL